RTRDVACLEPPTRTTDWSRGQEALVAPPRSLCRAWICAYVMLNFEARPLTSSLSPEPGRQPVRKSIRVYGVVQGVGFRPFVYRLAAEERLAGFIGNDTEGVIIELEGSETKIRAFLSRLTSETPPLARIDSVAIADLAPMGGTGFRI